jgi:hypothetical protein
MSVLGFFQKALMKLRPGLRTPSGEPIDRVKVWSGVLKADKSFVLFENGTCVVLLDPGGDLPAQAIALLKEWGPMHAGSPAGDFSVITPSQFPGWVVTSHRAEILTYVEPGAGDGRSQVEIGLIGRSRRDADARTLNVVHVEDRRPAGTQL